MAQLTPDSVMCQCDYLRIKLVTVIWWLSVDFIASCELLLLPLSAFMSYPIYLNILLKGLQWYRWTIVKPFYCLILPNTSHSSKPTHKCISWYAEDLLLKEIHTDKPDHIEISQSCFEVTVIIITSCNSGAN